MSMSKKADRQKDLTKKVLCSLLAAGVLSVGLPMGEVLAEDHSSKWIVNGQVIESQTATIDSAVKENLKAGAEITNSKFINNKLEGNSKDGIYGGIFRAMNTSDPNQQVTVKNSIFDGNSAVATQNNTWALGGVMMLKGGTTTLENVEFDNNKIIGAGEIVQVGGGAIYLDAVRNSGVTKPDGDADLIIKATQDMAYTGNTIKSGDNGSKWYDTYGGLAQSKGGFLFIDRDAEVGFDVADGKTLTIGNKNDADVNADTIASIIPKADGTVDFAVIEKTGTGTLTINSSLNDYYGSIKVSGGTLNVDRDWTLYNTLTSADNIVVNLANVELEKIEGTINAYDSDNKSVKEYTTKTSQGAIIVNGGTVNAKNINATKGSVTLKKGSLNVEETYTGDILAETGESKVTAKNIRGMAKVADGSSLTVNGESVEFEAPSVDYAGKNEYRHAALFVSNGAKAEYDAGTMVFKSANATTNSSSSTPGTAYNAAVVTGGSTLDIKTKELYVGSEAQGGDRGFRLTGEGNTLNITADKIVSYTGDEFVHVRQGATNRATITVGDFEAHTTWGKDDYGVAMLQVNEGGTIDFTADTAVFDGSTNAAGGVFGSGGWGTLNVTANEKLTIDGNICGTYGQLKGDDHKDTKFILNVTTKDLDMKGDINAGNMGSGYSNHDRKTEVTVKATGTGKLVGAINAYKQGTIAVDLGQGSLDGNVNARGGSIDLGGTITFDSAKTVFAAINGGTINLVSGTMDGSLNIDAGSNVNLTGATFKVANFDTALNGAGTLTLKGNGILETVAGQVFTIGDTELTKNDLIENAINTNNVDKVSFESGTLKLTDAEYTLDYVESASGVLKKAQSKTNILMSGQLVEGDEIKDEVSVDQAAGLGDNTLLDNIVVKDDSKNILIGTTLAGGNSEKVGDVIIDKDSKTVANGFSAAKLELGEGSTGLVLTNNEILNLGGSQGGDLVTVAGKTDGAGGVKLIIGTESAIGTATSTAGTLNIGDFTAPQADNKLDGSITVNDSSIVNVVNGNLNVSGGVTLAGGTVNIGNGVLTTDINAEKGTSTVTGTVHVGTLTAKSGVTLNLGAEDQAAKAAIEKLELEGGTLFLDPTWKIGETQEQGTEVTVANTDVDGKIIVGQNSTLSLGTEDAGKAQEAFVKSGLTWSESDTLAAVYVATPIELSSSDGTQGGLYVDPNAANDVKVGDNSITFKNGSVLMVDGTQIKSDAAISGVTTLAIDTGSKLYIDGAKKNETYKILDGEGADTGTVWKDANIISDNKLLKFTGDEGIDDGKYDVTASLQNVNKAFNDQVVIGNVVDTALAGDDVTAAQNFFNNAVNSKYNATDADVVNALNSVANMGELAGISRGTYSMSNIMTDAVSKHLSLANHAEADKDIWAHYIHSKEEVRDMEMGGVSGSYDMKYNGIVVGGDFYNKGKATAGVALSYAKGDVDSIGNSVATKNDAEYYGLSMYGRINNGASSVLGDISYLHGKNDITQTNSGTVITAAPKTDAFSMGVKAEKAYTMGAGKLIPYAGLRYLHLGVGDYSNSLGMHYNADDQNMWLLPVGVTYSYETKAGDWTIRPLVEAGYVWTAGDRDTEQTVSLNGASDGFGFNVADSGSFVGRFALEAEKTNIAFGLGYEYQKGDSVKANRLMANVRFSF